MPTPRHMINEQSTLRTSADARTSGNVVDDDPFRNSQDFDPWVSPIAALVSTAEDAGSFPRALAGPAEVVGFVTRTACRTAKSHDPRVNRVTPCLTSGTLLAAMSLTDVVLRHAPLDLRSGRVVEVCHVTNQKPLPNHPAVALRAREPVATLLHFGATVVSH